MKKRVLLLVLIAFCALVSSAALASDTPENLITCDIPETGFLPGAAMTGDGVLLTGVPLDRETPWVALIDESGAQRWVFSEAGKNAARYLCPESLEDGTYTVLRQTPRDDGGYECARLSLDQNGKLLSETALWSNTNWMVPYGEGTFSIGAFIYEDVIYPMVSLQYGAEEDNFDYYYTVEGCTSAEFNKGILTGDSLIISGQGIDDKFDRNAGLLYRIDLKGNVVWAKASTADTPRELVFANDVCVTADGQIIWIFTTVTGDEDDDYPIGRTSTVYCFDMDGEVLWRYETKPNDMLDFVAEAPGGFLFGSEGLELENCPYLGQGFLLFLNNDGQERPDLELPQLSGGSMELLGVTAGTENAVLCYGLLLEDPGFPDKPFLLEIPIPPAGE